MRVQRDVQSVIISRRDKMRKHYIFLMPGKPKIKV